MMAGKRNLLWLGAFVAFLFVLAAFDPALAQSDPFGSVVDKGEMLKNELVGIGIMLVGIVAVVLLILAIMNRVPWAWVMWCVVGAAGLKGVDEFIAFLTN